MKGTKTGLVLLLLAALYVPDYRVLARDDDKSRSSAGPAAKKAGTDKASKEKDRPASDGRRTDAKHDRGKTRAAGKAPVVLGKTVKLEFKLAAPDSEPTFPVLCATDEFVISRKVSDSNGEQGVEIAGKLSKFDEQGRLLLIFEAELRHRDNKEGSEAAFTSKGSALLEIGKVKILTVLGDTPLKVTATLAD